jgi:hypothetical protein
MDRRKFIGSSILVLTTAGATALLDSCAGGAPTVSSILTEVDNILMFIAPLGDGAAAIIEIADPPLAPLVQTAVAIYDKAIPVIEKYITDWAAASAAAQPGILAQLLATVQALQTDVRSIINSVTGVSATVLAEINSITASILGEVSALLKAIVSLGSAGGTTAALRRMAASRKYAKVAGPSVKTRRTDLVAQLLVPTGTPIDTARTALAQKLQNLNFK